MQSSNSNKALLVRTGIRVGIPVVALGVGVLLVRRMLKKNSDGTSSNTAPSLKNTSINRNNLTITPSDAALFANTLYGAMLDMGTDEEAIYSTLSKITTKDDMLMVIKAFGMKKYLWGTRAGFLGQDYNLIGWLRFELTKKELARIKPKFDQWGIPI